MYIVIKSVIALSLLSTIGIYSNTAGKKRPASEISGSTKIEENGPPKKVVIVGTTGQIRPIR